MTDDGDLGIYVKDGTKQKKDLQRLGETRFWDAHISPDTGNIVGRVIAGEDYTSSFYNYVDQAKYMDRLGLAINSLSNMPLDIKRIDHNPYDSVLFEGKYMTMRELGNALAGYNAAAKDINWDTFQRLSGAYHAGQFIGLSYSAITGHKFGSHPNWGENDYQRARSEFGYQLQSETKN